MGKPSLFVLGSFVIACSAKLARFPVPGESLRAQVVTIEPGGKGFNLAAGLARLGLVVDGLLAIGDDMRAGFAEPALSRAGLPQAMLRRFPGATGAGVGFTDAAGETLVAVDPGANLALSSADVEAVADRIRAAAMVLAQFEIADSPIAAAFRLARQAGRETLLNPSPFRMPPPALLADTSILVVNASEAEALARELGVPAATLGLPQGRDAAARFAETVRRHGPKLVVMTQGAAGAIAFPADGEPLYQPAFPVEAVDALGAGDAFAAGLAAALVEGRPLREALRQAAACGALTAQRLGVLEALPSERQLAGFIGAA